MGETICETVPNLTCYYLLLLIKERDFGGIRVVEILFKVEHRGFYFNVSDPMATGFNMKKSL